MDPFDEFEFKPLTNGLGFHKKTVSLKDGLKNSGVLDDELHGVPPSVPQSLLDETPAASAPAKRHSFEDVFSALEKKSAKKMASALELDFTEPLPREPKKEAMEIEIPLPTPMPTPQPVQSPFPQPEAYKSPALKRTAAQSQLSSVGTRRGAADSPRRNLMPTSVSLASALLDLIIVFALSLVFLMALVSVTKVDLSIVIRNLSHDVMTRLSLGVLFLSVMQMYVVVSRAYFGRTLGEWTFDVQLGRDEDQAKLFYPFKVVLRSLLNVITGIVGLPLLSLVLGYDLAGRLSGLQLYRQRF